MKKIEFVEGTFSEPTEEEINEEEEYLRSRKFYCPHCKRATIFHRCLGCGKRFCNSHAWEETESVDGHVIATYLLCYHCEEN